MDPRFREDDAAGALHHLRIELRLRCIKHFLNQSSQINIAYYCYNLPIPVIPANAGIHFRVLKYEATLRLHFKQPGTRHFVYWRDQRFNGACLATQTRLGGWV